MPKTTHESERKMKISVIIPTYQRSDMLMEALRSLREQTLFPGDFEVIIIDNSRDGVERLMKLSDEEEKLNLVYTHEPQCGLHYARHAGAKVAKYEILAYLDDDVICQPGWLKGMIEAFGDENVAMVAGRTLLKFEGVNSLPCNPRTFAGMYSEFELGDKSFFLAPYKSAVGANMGVRKKNLFAMGGFNPDGFGDRYLIKYRGDGESGLARKFYEAGYKILYSAEACLYHRVSAERQTLGYLVKRAQNSGIEFIYGEFRYKRNYLNIVRLTFLASAKAVIHLLLYCVTSKNTRPRHLVAYHIHSSAAGQAVRLLFSPQLQKQTIKESYI